MRDPCEFAPNRRRDDSFAEMQMMFDKVRGAFTSREPANPYSAPN